MQLDQSAQPASAGHAWDRHPEIPAQLRRRRAAARRCPPFSDRDDRPDPLDRPRPREVITVRCISERTVEFVGCDHIVAKTCRELSDGKIRHHRAERGGAWLVRSDLAAEVEALLTYRGFIVQSAL
jgi:hypothetical protein